MTEAVQAQIDRLWRCHEAADDRRPLWDSDIAHLESWPRTSSEHTGQLRRQLLEEADRAEALLPDAGPLAPTLRTGLDAVRLQAALLDVQAELSWAHPLQGLHSYLFWAVNDYPLRTAAHAEGYLAKLAALPAAVAQLRTRLEEAAADGRALIASHAARAAERIDDHLSTPLGEDPLLAQAPPTELDGAAVHAWTERVAASVRDDVRPALQGLATTLREVCVPRGRPDELCGMLHRPDGEAEYAALLDGFALPGLGAKQIHDIGLERLERLDAEYRVLGQEVFGSSDVAEVRRRLVEDESLQHRSATDVVAAARRLHTAAVAAADGWFTRTPDAHCEVRSTEHGAIAFYARPASDGSRAAAFYLNCLDPSVWGANLASTVFHEGVPGHHYQLALAQQDTHLHDVHRHLFLPAFGEGWGLYAERLADEMGLYERPLDRLGMLVADSMRACRLVVDTGMHAQGWSRQQAIDFMLANVPMGVHEVAAEIDRYIGWPGQATSYMVGRLEIQRLRRAASERLGDTFDLRRFHDVVLSHGMVSLPALREVVGAWDGS